MKQAEDHAYLSDAQHGRREGQASINVVALTRFMPETQHYQWCNTSMTDCDAKECYYRMTPELLALLYAKAGCPPQVVELLY
eukprot:14725391-Ditylum_brightwellii.AAC.1